MLHEDITGRIIAAAFAVHTTLGNGFQEVIYQRAMEIEMPLLNLTFVREQEMPLYYREQLIGTRRVDFLVEGIILVELKAIIQLDYVHLAQAKNYLEAFHSPSGCCSILAQRAWNISACIIIRASRPRESRRAVSHE